MEQTNEVLLEKFKKIIAMSNRVAMDVVAKSLLLSKDDLFEKLMDWNEHVPFKIEENIIVVSDMADFIDGIDAQFAAWEDVANTKDAKMKKGFSTGDSGWEARDLSPKEHPARVELEEFSIPEDQDHTTFEREARQITGISKTKKEGLPLPIVDPARRMFMIMSIIAGLAGVGMAIFVLYTLYSVTAVAEIAGYESILPWIEVTGINAWLETMTLITGIGMIAFGIAAAMAALSKRVYMLVTLAIGLGMGLLTILYINEWRPADLGALGVFELFQLLVLLMELVAFAPFTIGVIVELVKISQE